MKSLNPTPEISQPNGEQAPNALFGDEASQAAFSYAESLLRMMPENVRFFDLPLLEQLHRRPYHLVKLWGAFDLAKLVLDHQGQLFRSESCQTPKNKTHIERLMFSLGEGVFVVYDLPHLLVYAPTTQAATQVAARMKTYRKPEREKPGFRLVSLSSGGNPSAEPIPVKQAAPVNETEIGLHYGEDFVAWERTWLERLGQRPSGVSILFGPPGCGKTSYLRGLMSRLIDKWAFYYIPASAFDVLTSPRFVSFWLEEKSETRDKQRIAIMEDSESLLLPRDAGSQTDVSNLLNIGDGFLGEHLKLHVIATTNSPVRQLDPALLRPGRLMGTREFRRLSRPEAQRLAEAKGLALPDQNDFSLAEVYCSAVGNPSLNGDRQMGFAQ